MLQPGPTRRPSVVAVEKAFTKMNSANTKGQTIGAWMTVFGCFALAASPGLLRLQKTGDFLPREAETLAIYTAILTLVVCLLIVLLSVRQDTSGNTSLMSEGWKRMLYVGGLHRRDDTDSWGPTGAGLQVVDYFQSEENIAAFVKCKRAQFCSSNYYSRIWTDATFVTLLFGNSILAVGFLFEALFGNSDKDLAKPFYVQIIIWIVLTYGNLGDAFFVKVGMNELGFDYYITLLTSKVIEINGKADDQVRMNETDGLDRGVRVKVEKARKMASTIKDIIEGAKVDKRDRAKLMGVSITRAGAIRIMVALAGAIGSGLVKLAFS
jgi:hypothetical protein